MRTILAEYHDAFWLQHSSGTAVSANPFHVVVLLTECRDDSPPDWLPKRNAEDLVNPLLARFEIHDPVHRSAIEK